MQLLGVMDWHDPRGLRVEFADAPGGGRPGTASIFRLVSARSWCHDAVVVMIRSGLVAAR
jgi:hypothetical protein